MAPKGLRKRYLDRQPALCLAIYSPAHDKIWFFPGADAIRQLYADWLVSAGVRGCLIRVHFTFRQLAPMQLPAQPAQHSPICVHLRKSAASAPPFLGGGIQPAIRTAELLVETSWPSCLRVSVVNPHDDLLPSPAVESRVKRDENQGGLTPPPSPHPSFSLETESPPRSSAPSSTSR